MARRSSAVKVEKAVREAQEKKKAVLKTGLTL